MAAGRWMVIVRLHRGCTLDSRLSCRLSMAGLPGSDCADAQAVLIHGAELSLAFFRVWPGCQK